MKCTCTVHFLYAKRVAHVPSTSPRQHNAVKGGSLRASACKAATALSRHRLLHCTSDPKSEGVRSWKLFNTLRTRQFPPLDQSGLLASTLRRHPHVQRGKWPSPQRVPRIQGKANANETKARQAEKSVVRCGTAKAQD